MTGEEDRPTDVDEDGSENTVAVEGDESRDSDVEGDESRDSEYEARAFALCSRASDDLRSFEPPTDPPAIERALEYARDGVGDAVAIYVEARTEDSWVYFDEDAFDALESALNTYLDLFAACHGVERESAVPVRTAAETLLDTHDVVDTAAVLTDVDTPV